VVRTNNTEMPSEDLPTPGCNRQGTNENTDARNSLEGGRASKSLKGSAARVEPQGEGTMDLVLSSDIYRRGGTASMARR
ncbi:MAG TPA: hypothetical protein PLV85_00850, partial [Polyangiaceae bacterium]|nr:hypothetical protein [Polyangiaceae bacterium]